MGEAMKAIFDTNILIDYLNGIEAARKEIAQYQIKMISVITFMEVMIGAKTAWEEEAIRGFMASFEVVELSAEIAHEAITLRKALRLKIPDAIVYATARKEGCLIVSRNTKNLKPEWPDVRVPYKI